MPWRQVKASRVCPREPSLSRCRMNGVGWFGGAGAGGGPGLCKGNQGTSATECLGGNDLAVAVRHGCVARGPRRRVCRGGEAEVARQRRASCIVRRAYYYAAYRRRASKLKLLCPVPLYQVCKDPHSKQALPQWPNCTSDPQNYGTWACRTEQKKVARVAHRDAPHAACLMARASLER